MLTTVGISEAITAITIMVRHGITDREITTETTDAATETITIIIKKIMVFTGVLNVMHLVIATDHIDTDAMGAGNKKIFFVII